jgi:hypothetical protein
MIYPFWTEEVYVLLPLESMEQHDTIIGKALNIS